MCSNWSELCARWRLWIRPTVILLYALFVIIVLPLLIVNTVKDGFTKKDQLILIGGLFVFTTLPICIWHIMQHIVHFTKPILQKPIIRILWMVPIYAVNAVSEANNNPMQCIHSCFNHMDYMQQYIDSCIPIVACPSAVICCAWPQFYQQANARMSCILNVNTLLYNYYNNIPLSILNFSCSAWSTRNIRFT